MGPILEQIFEILTTSPGALAYHVVLAFSIFGAFQTSLSHWQRSGFPQGQRMVIGLGLLLALQLFLFAATALAWQGLVSIRFLLPPIDRAFSLLALLLVIWLWAFPERWRLADAAFILLALLVAAYLAFTMVWWSAQSPELFFNASWPDEIGVVVALSLGLAGVLLLLLRRPNSWGIGLAMLGLLIAGHLAHWLAPTLESDLSVALRLAQMAAFPWLFALPHRFPVYHPAQRADLLVAAGAGRWAYDAQVLRPFLGLAVETSFKGACQGLAAGLAKLLAADVVLLVSIAGERQLIQVYGGYDLEEEEAVEGFGLASSQAPLIAESLTRGRPLRLPASSTSADLQNLARSLSLPRAGALFVYPLTPTAEAISLGVILLSPHSNRGWTAEDQAFLAAVSQELISILQRTGSTLEAHEGLPDLRHNLVELQTFSERLWLENRELAVRLEAVRAELDQERDRSESLATLVDGQESLRKTIEQLEAENKRLLEDIRPRRVAPGEVEKDLAIELHLALEENAHLKSLLAERASQVSPPEPAGMQEAPANNKAEVVASIAQELRQPMSSIVGYTDLLLSESVGILGATQKKFLERIKASTERMGGLTDDIIQVTMLDSGALELSPEAVDLNEVIDEAVASVITRLREKNIVLHMDIPDHLPPIKADRDALTQILLHLLQNAGDATPAAGDISLHAQVEEKEAEPPFVLLQISDSGGGIPAEELPRVFSRLYRADNPLIQGVGDTGVGLSIVKALVEAHNGRVWVDSEVGRGSTFSVLLPVASAYQDFEVSGG